MLPPKMVLGQKGGRDMWIGNTCALAGSDNSWCCCSNFLMSTNTTRIKALPLWDMYEDSVVTTKERLITYAPSHYGICAARRLGGGCRHSGGLENGARFILWRPKMDVVDVMGVGMLSRRSVARYALRTSPMIQEGLDYDCDSCQFGWPGHYQWCDQWYRRWTTKQR